MLEERADVGLVQIGAECADGSRIVARDRRGDALDEGWADIALGVAEGQVGGSLSGRRHEAVDGLRHDRLLLGPRSNASGKRASPIRSPQRLSSR